MVSNQIIRNDIEGIIHSELPWNELANKNILITGANGFLPSYLVYSLLFANSVYRLNIHITGLVRNIAKSNLRFKDYLNNKSISFLVQDVNTPITTTNFDIIIHAASQASPKFYSIDPIGTALPNIIGTQNLLNLAIQSKVKNFLFFSSSEVYGQVTNNNIPIKETDFGYLDPLNYRSCYAESKRMGETLCISYFHQFQLPIKIVRPFHTYGPGMELDDGRVHADIVKNIISNKNITLSSDGSAKRAFCYIADATKGFLTVLLKGHPGNAYNIGNQREEYSIKNLALKLISLFPEKNLSVVFQSDINKDYVPSKVTRNCPDCTKISNLGWMADIDIENGFIRTINSYK